MARSKKGFVNQLLNKAKKQPLSFLVLLGLLVTLPLGILMILTGIIRFPGAFSEAHIYFEKAEYVLQPNAEVRAVVNSEDTKVGFVNLTVRFDPTQVQLSR